VLGDVAAVEGFAEHGFDDCLAADVQGFGFAVQFLEHGCGEVHVDALDSGFDDGEVAGEVGRDVLAVIGQVGDVIGRDLFYERASA
jgi:hypothetical protein